SSASSTTSREPRARSSSPTWSAISGTGCSSGSERIRLESIREMDPGRDRETAAGSPLAIARALPAFCRARPSIGRIDLEHLLGGALAGQVGARDADGLGGFEQGARPMIALAHLRQRELALSARQPMHGTDRKRRLFAHGPGL